MVGHAACGKGFSIPAAFSLGLGHRLQAPRLRRKNQRAGLVMLTEKKVSEITIDEIAANPRPNVFDPPLVPHNEVHGQGELSNHFIVMPASSQVA